MIYQIRSPSSSSSSPESVSSISCLSSNGTLETEDPPEENEQNEENEELEFVEDGISLINRSVFFCEIFQPTKEKIQGIFFVASLHQRSCH